jgi:hypothetical protein
MCSALWFAEPTTSRLGLTGGTPASTAWAVKRCAGSQFVPYRISSAPWRTGLAPHFFFKLAGWDFGYCGHYWPIVPAPDDRWWWLWRNWWNENWQGKPKYSEKTCSSVTLSTTNPTCCPDANPGRPGGKPATVQLVQCSWVKWSEASWLVSSHRTVAVQSLWAVAVSWG